METDWYQILGCSISSSRGDIEKAVRKLSLKYHSDKNKDDPEAPEKFLQIQKAKEILLDDSKRKDIDDVIRTKLKRKENESKKVQEMSENRKKMKEKLEQNLRQVSSTTPANHTNTSSSSSSSNKTMNDKERLEKIRKESAYKMEEMAKEAQETKMKKEKFSQDYLYNMKSTETNESSAQIKIKWRRSRESHSEESIYQLLKVYGTIEETKLGDKGTSATVTFTESISAQTCVDAYQSSEEYRVTLIIKDIPKVKPNVFTYDYSGKEKELRRAMGGEDTSTTNTGNTSDINSRFPNSAVFQSESELLSMMRRAVEKEKLLRSLSTDSINRSTHDNHPYTCAETASINVDTNADVTNNLKAAAGTTSGRISTGVNSQNPSNLMSKESDILARMKMRKQELAQNKAVS